MKTSLILSLASITAFAQGPLIPPPGADPNVGPVNALNGSGAPQATMKTLHQVEPRTPISSAPFTISASGSYYLTGNLSVATGTAITIAASGVALDLGGFTISSNAGIANGTGILIQSNCHDVTIQRGQIAGGATASGFVDGIGCVGNTARSIVVLGLSVTGCGGTGIRLPFNADSRVELCVVRSAADTGISAGTVRQSTADNCLRIGIEAIMASDCYGSSAGSASVPTYGINSQTALNCTGESKNGGTGIYTTLRAQSCTGTSSGANDGLSSSGVALNCTGSSSTGRGLYANNAQNCNGASLGAGTGLHADVAQNCTGFSSSGTGLFAGTSADGCKGQSTQGGDGLYSAGTASNSTGVSGSGRGLYAERSAQNCHGTSNGGGTGLVTSIAQNCYGLSQSGTGLTFTKIGALCWGERTVPFATNYVTGNGIGGTTVNLP